MVFLSIIRTFRKGVFAPVALTVFWFFFAKDLFSKDDALVDHFKKSALPAWEKLSSLEYNIDGSIVNVQEGGSEQRVEKKYNIRQTKSNKLLEELSGDDKTPGSIVAFNPDYLFTLERKTISSDWVLTDLTPQKNTSVRVKDIYRFQLGRGIQNALLSLGSCNLLALCKESAFTVSSAERVSVDGDDCVLVKFTNQHPIDSLPFQAIQSGSITLDPKLYWCLRKFELDLKYTNGVVKSRAYKILIKPGEITGVPIPVEIELYNQNQELDHSQVSGSTPRKSNTKYNIREVRFIPEGEFRLAYFGFIEPDRPRTAFPYYLLILFCAFCCLAIAFGLRWAVQK